MPVSIGPDQSDQAVSTRHQSATARTIVTRCSIGLRRNGKDVFEIPDVLKAGEGTGVNSGRHPNAIGLACARVRSRINVWGPDRVRYRIPNAGH